MIAGLPSFVPVAFDLFGKYLVVVVLSILAIYNTKF